MNPPLNEDQLIADYLTGELIPAGVAARHHLTLSQLLEWAERPETKAKLDTLHRFITRRAETIAANARAAAMTVLQTIATTYSDPLESRRAAAAIVRATNPLPVVVRRRSAAQRLISHPSPPSHPPRPTPLTFKLSPVHLTNPPNFPTPLADTPPGAPAHPVPDSGPKMGRASSQPVSLQSGPVPHPEPASPELPADAQGRAPGSDTQRALPTFTFDPTSPPAAPSHAIANGRHNGARPDRTPPDTG